MLRSEPAKFFIFLSHYSIVSSVGTCSSVTTLGSLAAFLGGLDFGNAGGSFFVDSSVSN